MSSPSFNNECRLGRMCQNPFCSTCFPGLHHQNGIQKSTPHHRAWNHHHPDGPILGKHKGQEPLTVVSSSTPLPSMISSGSSSNSHNTAAATAVVPSTQTARSISADLIELVVIQCDTNGRVIKSLKTIRCLANITLRQLRDDVLKHEIPILDIPPLCYYSFLRIKAGHPNLITLDQEIGDKAYKAKHFAPPYDETPKLRIVYDTNTITMGRDIGGGGESGVASDRKLSSTAGSHPNHHPSLPSLSQTFINTLNSQQVSIYCVRCMVEGQPSSSNSGSILGTIRLADTATLSEIRTTLTEQLPSTIPKEYQFGRMFVGGQIAKITLEQERHDSKIPFLAKHFKPEIIVLTKHYYTEEELIEEETKFRELKSLAEPLYQQQINPRDFIKHKAPKYINAFLNSSGGVLLFGAHDDGTIERVPISGAMDDKCTTIQDRVQKAWTTKDDIRKLVDGIARNMDPVVDHDLIEIKFVPVRRKDGGGDQMAKTTTTTSEEFKNNEEEIYNVVEIHVKSGVELGRQNIYFMNNHSFEAYERRDGSMNEMDIGTIDDSLAKESSQHGKTSPIMWLGGWRQLRSSFDFYPLMRRLSDPWAGREWLFAEVRQCLFRATYQEEIFSATKTASSSFGVGIRGPRGMGKTSFMSELALRPKHISGLEVVACHLCRADDSNTLNPALFVHSIAAMLARNCKAYRSLMANDPFMSSSSSSPSGGNGGDSVGAAMLGALLPEHCENNPDDAFLRGVLKPLQEIDIRRNENSRRRLGKNQDKGALRSPMVILVDAIDESLAWDASEQHRDRRHGSSDTSPTIVHLLERGLAACGLPPWIKFIVSFRGDLKKVPGPILLLSNRLDVIDMDDFNPNNPMKLLRAQDDIRLFAEAYLVRAKPDSSLGRLVGSLPAANSSQAARKVPDLRGKYLEEWQCEEKPNQWKACEEVMLVDLNYSQSIGLDQCYVVNQKLQLFDANLVTFTRTGIKSGKVQNIRPPAAEADNTSDQDEKDGSLATSNLRFASRGEGMKLSCSHCKEVGHLWSGCPKQKQELADKNSALKRKNQLLDALARNSQGNYLYARSVLEDINSGSLQMEQVQSLPSGLDHLYSKFFESYFGGRNDDGDGNGEEGAKPRLRVVKPVLEVLLAATNRGLTKRDIAHAVVTGGACDPAFVEYCLRDIHWVLDIDYPKGHHPRYSIRHESIRVWLREDATARALGLEEDRGHALLAASLLQRCWPQQVLLSNWLQNGSALDPSLWSSPSPQSAGSPWYQWTGWKPNIEDEDIYNCVTHLIRANPQGCDADLVALLKTIGKENLNSVVRKRQTTALHSASERGDVRAIKLLLDAGADTGIRVRGRCPIHVAASKGFAETVEMLLDAGANVASVTPRSGRTALHLAVQRGSVLTVECILKFIQNLEGSNSQKYSEKMSLVDASQTHTGRTPLSFAVNSGHDEVVRLLLQANASVFLADRWGRTPLYFAARYNRLSSEVVSELVAAPRGEETLYWGEFQHNRSPLHEAVWYGHLDIVRVLLEANADPNLVENDYRTPLHDAACFGAFGHDRGRGHRRRDGVQMVAIEKEDPPKEDREQNQKVDSSSSSSSNNIERHNDESKQQERRHAVLQLLLDSGRCRVNQGESHGCTALWYAATGGWLVAVEALINAGAVVDPERQLQLSYIPGMGMGDHASPLLRTIHLGHYETAKLLLDKGAPVGVEVLRRLENDSSLSQIPKDLAEELDKRSKETKSTAKAIVTPTNDQNSCCIGYEHATKCIPTPVDAFAQPPPVLKSTEF